MDRIDQLETFVRAARAGSFSKAAKQLRLAPSVVTSRIQHLEQELGGPLFHRSTRSVQLSSLGEAILQDCERICTLSQSVRSTARELARGAPAGLLRIHAVPGFVLGQFGGIIKDFQQRYPDVQLDLVIADEVVDPVKGGFDCSLQIFTPATEELVIRPLFPVRRIFCATPEYLAAHGTPQRPADLAQHRLAFYANTPSRDKWILRKDAEEFTLRLKASLLTNSSHMLAEYALQSTGLACLPTVVAAELVLQGRLAWVLREFQLPIFHLSAVYPQTQRGSSSLRLFIQTLIEHLPAAPTWDVALGLGSDFEASIRDS